MDIAGTDPRTGDHFDYYAFVPEPLPTEVNLSQATWTVASLAAEALGRLNQACTQLRNPGLLIAPSLFKESVSTSALEGTYGALPEVLEARLPQFSPRTPEVKEIQAYHEMARLAFDWAVDRPITLGMLKDLQRILAEGSKKPPPDAGQIRTRQVIIGPENCTVHDARFVPPPPDDRLQAGLDAWQEWINADLQLPGVVRAAMAHYQFECLHPFSDGNGRVGRLVIILMLLRDGSLPAPSLTISPWLLKRREEYQDHLLRVSQTGDWNPWVQFMCTALREQCLAHVEVAQRLLDWTTNLRAQLDDRRWGGVITKLAEQLIDWPVVTGRWVVETFNVTLPTAQNAIDRLMNLGVLTEMTGSNYNRVYGAKEVMDLVDSL